MIPCAFADCPHEGVEAPRATLFFTDGAREWEVPLILSLQVCKTCQPRVTVEGTVSQELISAIAAMRPGVIYTSSSLEWVPFTHPEYVAMKSHSPN